MYNEKEKEQEANVQFAQKYGISIKILDQAAQEVYDSFNSHDFESDDARWGRALRRARNSYRRIANSLKDANEGMIVCRLRDHDYSRRYYNDALKTANAEGMQAAIEQGKMNEAGQPLFQYGDDKGKIITKPTAYGSAIGYFIYNKDGKEEFDVRLINISERDVEKNIAVCQTGRISATPGKQSPQNFKYSNKPVMWYKANTIDADHIAPYNTDEMITILQDWLSAFDNDNDKIAKFTDLNSLFDWGKEHCHRQRGDNYEYDFCFYPGRITDIGVTEKDYEDVLVYIELLDYNTLDSYSIPVYIPSGMFKGLHLEDDLPGVCVLQSYAYNKDEPNTNRWHLGGFLPAQRDVVVEEFFGVSYGDEDV